MKEMTVAEFEKCLRAGLGRCILFLRDCKDREQYRAAVLSACLNDYAYDGQCEGTRARYTYELLSCFNDDEYFYSRTDARLASVFGGSDEYWGFEHLFDTVLQFAVHGNETAKGLIRKIYAELLNRLAVKTRKPYEVDYDAQWLDHICMRAVEQGDIDTFLKIAADLGGLFKRTDEFDADYFDGFVFTADERYGKDNITAVLKGAADPDGNITAYVQSVDKSNEPYELTETEKKRIEKARAKRKKRIQRERDRKPNVKKITRKMRKFDNTDLDGAWHSVSFDIVCNEDTVFPTEAYMYVYTGLCACCRNDVVKAMYKHGLLNDELLRECEFDSYAETRKLAAKLLRGDN